MCPASGAPRSATTSATSPASSLAAAIGDLPGAPLRIVVNPNSPTGRWTAPEDLEELLGEVTGVVAVDEAYCDFAPASCLPLLDRHENWLVLRTLSKSHALAGL